MEKTQLIAAANANRIGPGDRITESSDHWTVSMLIDPDLGQVMLIDRKCRRKFSPKCMSRYSKMMRNGEWGISDSKIQFDSKGRLINGQHRLAAAIDAGYTLEATVEFGVEAGGYGTNRGLLGKMSDNAYFKYPDIDWDTFGPVGNLLAKMRKGFVSTDPDVEGAIRRHKAELKAMKENSVEARGKNSSAPFRTARYICRNGLPDNEDLQSRITDASEFVATGVITSRKAGKAEAELTKFRESIVRKEGMFACLKSSSDSDRIKAVIALSKVITAYVYYPVKIDEQKVENMVYAQAAAFFAIPEPLPDEPVKAPAAKKTSKARTERIAGEPDGKKGPKKKVAPILREDGTYVLPEGLVFEKPKRGNYKFARISDLSILPDILKKDADGNFPASDGGSCYHVGGTKELKKGLRALVIKVEPKAKLGVVLYSDGLVVVDGRLDQLVGGTLAAPLWRK